MRRAGVAASIRRLAGKGIVRAGALLASLPILVLGSALRGRGRGPQPEVILHAGEHKTGTTTLQSVLRRERRRLARQGLYVLRAGQGSNGAHHRLIYSLTGQPLARVSPALLRAELARASARRVLISSEAAKMAIVNGQGHRLIDALRSAGAGRVTLLLYLRSPFGLANASYSGLTSRLELAGAGFTAFFANYDCAPAYRYDRFLDLAERDDVELVVRPYSGAVRRSVLADFAAALGVDVDGIPEPRHNPSFGPVGLEALRSIAAECGELDVKRRHRLHEPLREIARGLPEEPFWGMDADGEALLGRADGRTDAFARAVWGRGWREVVGEERRPLNVFDPANDGQAALLDSTLRRMRLVAAQILG